MVKALVSLTTGGGYLQVGQKSPAIFGDPPIELACSLVIPPICRGLDFVTPPHYQGSILIAVNFVQITRLDLPR